MAAEASSPTEEGNNDNVGSKRLENGTLWKVHVGLVLVQVGYGSSFVLSKVALTTGVNPIVFAVYRDVICLLVLIPLAYFTEKVRNTFLITHELMKDGFPALLLTGPYKWMGSFVNIVFYIGWFCYTSKRIRQGRHSTKFQVCRILLQVVTSLVSTSATLLYNWVKRRPLTVQIVALLVGAGFFGAFITQLLMLYGLFLTSAAYASTMSILAPLFTFIVSISFGFEQIRFNRLDGQAKLGGLFSAIFGAVVLALYLGPVVLGQRDSGVHTIPSSDVDPSGFIAHALLYLKISSWQLGVLCLFLAGFTLSLTISIQVPILARYPAPITVSAVAYFFGAIMLLVTALSTVKDASDLVVMERSAVISYVYNGLVPAAFNFTVLIWSVQKAGPVLVASYVPLQLFSAAAMAYIFLGESIHLGSVLGALLIINGLGFITWGQVRSRTVASLSIKAAPPLDGVPVTTAAYSLDEPLLGNLL